MKYQIKVAALTAAIVVASLSMADARGDGPRQISFEALDTNGDGQVTKEEMEARAAARFVDADTNGDGLLSKEELVARAEAGTADRVDRMLQRFDKNDDGQLSQDELPQRRGTGRMFSRVDADGDGSISKEEFETAQSEMKDRSNKRKNKN